MPNITNIKSKKEIPNPPDHLDGETAKRYWKIYYVAMEQNGEINDKILSDIETLAFLEVQRETIQAEINETGLFSRFDSKNGPVVQSNGLEKTLKNVNNSLRYLKRELGIYEKTKGSSMNNFKKKNY